MDAQQLRKQSRDQQAAANKKRLYQTKIAPTDIHIRSIRRRGGYLLVNLPIGTRLTLGFLISALIASLVTGAIGLQQSQSLSRQANFYQSLLSSNTQLTTAADFLQLMNTEIHTVLSQESTANPSKDTLATEKDAVKGLEKRYDQTLSNYIHGELVRSHPEMMTLLIEANNQNQGDQQATLASSTERTWLVYSAAQEQILQSLAKGQLIEAQHLEQVQGELTNADATSAIRALIHFNDTLAKTVVVSADVERQNQYIYTAIGSALAFLIIVLIGWFISNTIVQRLSQLRQVTQAVEQGELDKRVNVVGQDEIAHVSASVNAMLVAIVGLLEESRGQRDALTNAAEHLFSDMRIVSAGDLRINAPISNDPIGMLANAFNFTVGRFRRFVQRTKTTAEQLDVIARQEIEHAEAFEQAIVAMKEEKMPEADPRVLGKRTGNLSPARENNKQPEEDPDEHIKNMLKRLQQVEDESLAAHTHAFIKSSEQISTSIERLNTTIASQWIGQNQQQSTNTAAMQKQELQMLKTTLTRMTREAQNVQSKTAQELAELKRSLSNLAITLQEGSFRSGIEALSVENTELTRQCNAFASDIIKLGRQIAVLSQEIRTGIVTFQLDSADIKNNKTGYTAQELQVENQTQKKISGNLFGARSIRE